MPRLCWIFFNKLGEKYFYVMKRMKSSGNQQKALNKWIGLNGYGALVLED